MDQTTSPEPRDTVLIHGRPAPWTSVPALVRGKARQHGDRVFLTIDGTELSYRQLDGRSDLVAANLARLGIGPGGCVASLLPNCLAPLIVQATLGFSSAILDAAALGFLGLGAQPPTPEWGTMLADALQFYSRAWWLLTFPGLAILVTVMAFNLLGDGLRDALDPKLRR